MDKFMLKKWAEVKSSRHEDNVPAPVITKVKGRPPLSVYLAVARQLGADPNVAKKWRSGEWEMSEREKALLERYSK